MIKQEKRQLLILAIVAVALITLASLLTLLANEHLKSRERDKSATKRALGVVTSRAKFDAFAGAELCREAIRSQVPGKIITLHMDSRSARYDEFEKTNTLLFVVDAVPEGQNFLSEHASTKALHAQCITSAEDNRLVNLIVAPADGS
ncbi:hypothetical protein L1F30_11690 [Simiduia sp. 21SJ11W-1]|uniref:hypothetical protein n=1 Tax=Simiduia sp. 21SJ11W-1 TaxID=2909669 RepID=UPI00209F2901|nr:hypothetical protein [Simiduia sp. 21SJ11W-1]UTA46822.1 hypothetical protein L1F30_11690 [Simiduia sp. 21SJ11W-1]